MAPAIRKSARMGVLGAISLSLAACVSFEAAVPESLLTLSSTATASSGSGAQTGSAGEAGAIAVLVPETPAKLDVVRVPVTVTQTEIAYLKDAVWVEKPARLFRRLLGETLRARADVLVLDSDDTPTLAAQSLRGTLLDMGYDTSSSSVIIRYDAVRTDAAGKVVSRRFEARESGVLPEAGDVGPALNRAANTIAAEVADWVLGGDAA